MTTPLRATALAALLTLTACLDDCSCSSADKPAAGSSTVPTAVRTNPKDVKLFDDAKAEACQQVMKAGRPVCVDTDGDEQFCFQFGNARDHLNRSLHMLVSCGGSTKMDTKDAYLRIRDRVLILDGLVEVHKCDGRWIPKVAADCKGPPQS